MRVESSLIGHKSRSFDVRWTKISSVEASHLVLTASEDGTAKLWDAANRSCLFTFKHSIDCEVLRVAFLDLEGARVVTCGADGKAIIWGLKTTGAGRRKYEQVCALDHGDAQIYACEVCMRGRSLSDLAISASVLTCSPEIVAEDVAQGQVPRKSTAFPSSPISAEFLLTAADDKLYIWDLTPAACAAPRVWSFRSIKNGGGQAGEECSTANAYGGPRNAENAAYIFDAKISPHETHRIAVALSDGTVRVLETDNEGEPNVTRDTCATLNMRTLVLELCNKETQNGCGADGDQDFALPAQQQLQHPTGVAWTADGASLLVALGDGSIVVLDVCMSSSGKSDNPSSMFVVRALLKGHERGCFGVCSFATSAACDTVEVGAKRKPQHRDRSHAFSWSSDGSLCEWELSVEGIQRTPLKRLQIPNYPIYSCALGTSDGRIEDALMVCAGGGAGAGNAGASGFLGVPVHLVRLMG